MPKLRNHIIHKKITFILAICLALVSIIAYFLFHQDKQTTLETSIFHDVPSIVTSPAKIDSTVTKKLEGYYYPNIPTLLCNGVASYHFKTSSAYSASERLDTKNPGEMILSAKIRQTLIAFDDSGYIILNVIHIDNGSELILYSRYNSEGTLEHIFTGAETKGSSELPIAKSLVYAFQVTRQNKNNYDLMEISGNGFATMHYEQTNPHTLSKTIVSITPFESTGGRSINVLDSNISIILNTDNIVKQMIVKERLQLTLTANDWVTSQATLKFQLENLQRGNNSAVCKKPLDHTLQKLQVTELPLPLIDAEIITTSHPTEPVQRSLKKLNSILAKTKMEDTEETERNILLDKIARRLVQYPEEITVVVNEILSSRADIPYAQALVGSLAGADTQSSQTALLSVMKALDTKKDVDLFQHAIRSHQFINHPSLDNVGYLNRLYEDSFRDIESREVALLAVGSTSAKLTEAQEQNTYVDVLMEHARDSNSVREQLIAVAALGNQGHPDAFEFLQSYIIDSENNADIAAFAIDSLRHIHNPDVEPFLLELISMKENNASLSYKAAIALSSRSLDGGTLEKLAELYLQRRQASESNNPVNLALLEILTAPEQSTRSQIQNFRESIFAHSDLTDTEKRLLGSYR